LVRQAGRTAPWLALFALYPGFPSGGWPAPRHLTLIVPRTYRKIGFSIHQGSKARGLSRAWSSV